MTQIRRVLKQVDDLDGLAVELNVLFPAASKLFLDVACDGCWQPWLVEELHSYSHRTGYWTVALYARKQCGKLESIVIVREVRARLFALRWWQGGQRGERGHRLVVCPSGYTVNLDRQSFAVVTMKLTFNRGVNNLDILLSLMVL